MWCAYLFALIALISLPAALQSQSVIIIIAWLAQTFLQLVLLSIIMVGQNLQAQEAEKQTKQVLNEILRLEKKEIKKEEQILKDEKKELEYMQKGEL